MPVDHRKGMDRCDTKCPDLPGLCYLGRGHRIKHRVLAGICEHHWTITAEWNDGDTASVLRATEHVR